MKSYIYLIMIFLTTVLLMSCEENYIPETSVSQQEIVVEGYIEYGEGANPTYVLLTRSIPFISTIKSDQFTSFFVRKATVSVFDGVKNVNLTEVCLDQIPPELKKEVYAVLGLNPDSTSSNICVYADLFDQIKREPGRKYDLSVTVDGKVITATTTIPQYIPIYDFKWKEPPGKPRDTLAELNVKINDPKGIKNYYRYFTSTQGGPLIPPFGSVTDDAIFDGKEFEFPLQRAQRRGSGFDPETFGLYKRGDSITVKWCTIDKAHFDFWNTRDFSANSGGPFAAYTRISTNINGGLGIWGGYAVGTYSMRVPLK
jgi:hypothetical protein